MPTATKKTGVYPVDFFSDSVTAGYCGREFARDDYGGFLEELGIPRESLVLLKQIHSANLVLVTEDARPDRDCRADGMITQSGDYALGVLTADCVPVFFHAEDRGVIGILHAGWRGICFGIVPKMMQALRQNFKADPAAVKVAIGPCIRKCCYEVGEEFRELFGTCYEEVLMPEGEPRKGYVDLPATVVRQLSQEGLEPAQLYDCDVCTSCSHEHFYSYRREKGTHERNLSVIRLKKK